MLNSTQLVECFVEGCDSLSAPPLEIAVQGSEAMRNYFDSLESAGGIEYLYESKLVLVGRGFAGKTTLARKLKDPSYGIGKPIKSTEGIAIDTWDLSMPLANAQKFRFNIWDFGGQEKYDATHQFFITERTLYLFITEARQESTYLDFDYWLNIIQMLGNNSPVVVVQNKIDVRRKELPSESYKEQYPNIVDFVDVSCAVGHEDTIDDLLTKIKDGVNRLPQLGDQLPSEWVQVREDLKSLDVDTIPYNRYRRICEKRGLDKRKADFLSRYYHDLGVIVHYPDDPLLKKLVVLNPDWAVDGVYKVLDTDRVQENAGRFNNSDLDVIWEDDKYADMRPQLLALMKNYELCFELPEKGKYIAPELLPANPPPYERIKRAGRLTFIYNYKLMPAGLITRLIVKLHTMIEGDTFWRGGVVVEREGSRASIIEDNPGRQIRIDIQGDETNRDLLAIIREAFTEIYATFHRRIQYEELIPCVCDQCTEQVVDGQEPHYFNWEHLRSFANRKEPTIQCLESADAVSVDTLMGNIGENYQMWALEPRMARRPVQPVPPPTVVPPVPAWEKIATYTVGVVLAAVLIVFAVLTPNPTDFQGKVFMVFLALGTSGIGALIPGFIDVSYQGWIRAGGALALFVIVLVATGLLGGG